MEGWSHRSCCMSLWGFGVVTRIGSVVEVLAASSSNLVRVDVCLSTLSPSPATLVPSKFGYFIDVLCKVVWCCLLWLIMTNLWLTEFVVCDDAV